MPEIITRFSRLTPSLFLLPDDGLSSQQSRSRYAAKSSGFQDFLRLHNHWPSSLAAHLAACRSSLVVCRVPFVACRSSLEQRPSGRAMLPLHPTLLKTQSRGRREFDRGSILLRSRLPCSRSRAGLRRFSCERLSRQVAPCSPCANSSSRPSWIAIRLGLPSPLPARSGRGDIPFWLCSVAFGRGMPSVLMRRINSGFPAEF